MSGLRTSERPLESRAFLAPPISSFLPAETFYDSDDGESSESGSDMEELFDTHDFVTVAQDLMLVRHRCFHPTLDLNGLAAKFQREFGVSRDTQELVMRLQKLQAPEFQGLFVLYLKAISIAKNSQHGSDVSTGIRSEYQPLLESTRTSCETQLFQMMYDNDKFQQEASEILAVDVSGWNFPKYTRVVSKAELRRCCKGIDDLFRRQASGDAASPHQAFTLLAPGTSMERLQITDTASRYDSYAVFNHLEQPIFDRLVLFAKDPNLVERLALQRQQQREANRIKQKTSQQLRSIFDMLRVKQEAKLEQMQAEEMQHIQRQLERALEDDLQHIRQMHTALLNHEQAKIKAKYEEQKLALSEKAQAMQRDVLTLQKKCESSGWHDLERLNQATSLQVERIFGTSEYLLRLLILAEDLDAEPLRRALVRYLSEEEKLPQFVLRREFTSKMIADTTVLAILKEASTKDLREVESFGRNFLHQDLVARELHTRKVELGRFAAGLTNERLRAARRLANTSSNKMGGISQLADNQADTGTSEGDIDSDSHRGLLLDAEFDRFASALADFPEILTQEFERRREFSCVKMDSTGVERHVSFSTEDCLLQLEASHQYCTVCATKQRRQGEAGKWIFEVTVELFGGDGESLLIGWEVPRAAAETASSSGTPVGSSQGKSNDALGAAASASIVPGISPSEDGRSFGVTWQADGGLDMGMLHANGVSKSGTPSFRAGDVVGCTIDQDQAVPQLRFYLNGDLVLPMARTTNSTGLITSSSAGSGTNKPSGIAVLNPAYCLLPVVSMYSSSMKPQMRVRFNFRGDFKFPIAGFDPFGAPL
ncbi:hypothetical protein BBJ28_00017582 [Nothophytophthora sp. Chile5]|nr:hypothetical protein BBJ28_00017582 [Nothophytophthora sp. Chile5]